MQFDFNLIFVALKWDAGLARTASSTNQKSKSQLQTLKGKFYELRMQFRPCCIAPVRHLKRKLKQRALFMNKRISQLILNFDILELEFGLGPWEWILAFLGFE